MRKGHFLSFIVAVLAAGPAWAQAPAYPSKPIRMPEYPTVAESGLPGFGVDQWYALFLPGGTSKDIAARLHESVAKVVLDPEIRKIQLGQGLDAVANTPAEFGAIYTSEIARWAKVVKAIGLEPN